MNQRALKNSILHVCFPHFWYNGVLEGSFVVCIGRFNLEEKLRRWNFKLSSFQFIMTSCLMHLVILPFMFITGNNYRPLFICLQILWISVNIGRLFIIVEPTHRCLEEVSNFMCNRRLEFDTFCYSMRRRIHWLCTCWAKSRIKRSNKR